LLALRVGERSNEQRWFHDQLFGATASPTSNQMKLQ
jgi:hypothetical protein